jgi:hypothetical protein
MGLSQDWECFAQCEYMGNLGNGFETAQDTPGLRLCCSATWPVKKAFSKRSEQYRQYKQWKKIGADSRIFALHCNLGLYTYNFKIF